MNGVDTGPGLLRPDLVALELAGRTAPMALRELHAGIRGIDAVVDPEVLLLNLLARQALSDNCLDAEIALPHVRTRAVNRIVLAVGRSDLGIDFGDSHRSIRLVCLIAAPNESVVEYLRCAAGIARALRDEVRRAELLGARTVDVFHRVWSQGILSVD